MLAVPNLWKMLRSIYLLCLAHNVSFNFNFAQYFNPLIVQGQLSILNSSLYASTDLLWLYCKRNSSKRVHQCLVRSRSWRSALGRHMPRTPGDQGSRKRSNNPIDISNGIPRTQNHLPRSYELRHQALANHHGCDSDWGDPRWRVSCRCSADAEAHRSFTRDQIVDLKCGDRHKRKRTVLFISFIFFFFSLQFNSLSAHFVPTSVK